MIDAKTEIVQCFRRMPLDISNWIKFPLQKDSDGYLRLLIPKPNGKTAVLVIDTGSTGGILLNPDSWKKWKSSHENWPMTMRTGSMVGSGMSMTEETCAKEISFGPLTLTDVPISEAFPTDIVIGGDNYEATFGMGALKRLDLIVDAIHGVAYLRPRNEKPPRYSYNRLAAMFLPRDPDLNLKDQEFTAHVIKDGPAYVAGVRDGDVLLKLNGREIKNWPEFIEMADKVKDLPAGKTLSLTLKREKKVFEISVVLRDFTVP